MAASDSSDFVPMISKVDPLEDYIQLIRTFVQTRDITDQQMRDNFQKISVAAREAVWQLLFGEGKQIEGGTNGDSQMDDEDGGGGHDKNGENDENNEKDENDDDDEDELTEEEKKAADLLEEYKRDACYHAPFYYNNWAYTLRNELLRRKMYVFWRVIMVKKELGPCWARDSDYFTDSEDPEPAAFYAYAGCVAPFAKKGAENGNGAQTSATDNYVVPSMPKKVSAEQELKSTLVKAIITDEDPLLDYQNLIRIYVRCRNIFSDRIIQANYEKVAKATRKAIWKFLFSKQNPSDDDLLKASELLEEHKSHACFHGPYDYNEWIFKVRDELLSRDMIDFWRDTVVKLELGPCWARDSDYFDDMDDPEPATFYDFADCKAPFQVGTNIKTK